MSERQFKVLAAFGREQRDTMRAAGCPDSVPWSLVAPHEKQALRNHSQTLERLDERGGLSPKELVAVLNDKPWDTVRSMSDAEAVAHLLAIMGAR